MGGTTGEGAIAIHRRHCQPLIKLQHVGAARSRHGASYTSKMQGDGHLTGRSGQSSLHQINVRSVSCASLDNPQVLIRRPAAADL